eukprot:Clim_evm15s108 gene=Clim_evmTU15s108
MRTALHDAALAGDDKAVKKILKKGVHVNEEDEHKFTALALACREGHKEVVELLVASGADVQSQLGEERDTPLHWAAFNCQPDIIDILLTRGANIHAKDEHGETPLLWACQEGHVEAAHRLLEHGADIYDSDNLGRTGLHISADRGHTDLVEELLMQGLDMEVTDRIHFTPLHRATIEGRKECAEYLVNAGARLDVKDKKGNTPLHWACRTGNNEMTVLFIYAGAALNLRNNGGETALHTACQYANRDIAQLLILAGAPVDASDSKGRTPRDIDEVFVDSGISLYDMIKENLIAQGWLPPGAYPAVPMGSQMSDISSGMTTSNGATLTATNSTLLNPTKRVAAAQNLLMSRSNTTLGTETSLRAPGLTACDEGPEDVLQDDQSVRTGDLPILSEHDNQDGAIGLFDASAEVMPSALPKDAVGPTVTAVAVARRVSDSQSAPVRHQSEAAAAALARRDGTTIVRGTEGLPQTAEFGCDAGQFVDDTFKELQEAAAATFTLPSAEELELPSTSGERTAYVVLPETDMPQGRQRSSFVRNMEVYLNDENDAYADAQEDDEDPETVKAAVVQEKSVEQKVPQQPDVRPGIPPMTETPRLLKQDSVADLTHLTLEQRAARFEEVMKMLKPDLVSFEGIMPETHTVLDQMEQAHSMATTFMHLDVAAHTLSSQEAAVKCINVQANTAKGEYEVAKIKLESALATDDEDEEALNAAKVQRDEAEKRYMDLMGKHLEALDEHQAQLTEFMAAVNGTRVLLGQGTTGYENGDLRDSTPDEVPSQSSYATLDSGFNTVRTNEMSTKDDSTDPADAILEYAHLASDVLGTTYEDFFPKMHRSQLLAASLLQEMRACLEWREDRDTLVSTMRGANISVLDRAYVMAELRIRDAEEQSNRVRASLESSAAIRKIYDQTMTTAEQVRVLEKEYEGLMDEISVLEMERKRDSVRGVNRRGMDATLKSRKAQASDIKRRMAKLRSVRPLRKLAVSYPELRLGDSTGSLAATLSDLGTSTAAVTVGGGIPTDQTPKVVIQEPDNVDEMTQDALNEELVKHNSELESLLERRDDEADRIDELEVERKKIFRRVARASRAEDPENEKIIERIRDDLKAANESLAALDRQIATKEAQIKALKQAANRDRTISETGSGATSACDRETNSSTDDLYLGEAVVGNSDGTSNNALWKSQLFQIKQLQRGSAATEAFVAGAPGLRDNLVIKTYEFPEVVPVSVVHKIATLSQLSHPLLNQVHSWRCQNRHLKLAEDYQETGSVQPMLRKLQGDFHSEAPREKCLFTLRGIMRQVIRAAAFLHAHGLSHGSICPENILFDSTTSAVKLNDAVIPQALRQAYGGASAMSPMSAIFEAPERARNSSYADTPLLKSFIEDSWAIGMTFLCVYVGEAVNYSAPNDQFMLLNDGEPLELDALVSKAAKGIEHDCVAVLKQLLQSNPMERMTCANALQTPFLAANVSALEVPQNLVLTPSSVESQRTLSSRLVQQQIKNGLAVANDAETCLTIVLSSVEDTQKSAAELIEAFIDMDIEDVVGKELIIKEDAPDAQAQMTGPLLSRAIAHYTGIEKEQDSSMFLCSPNKSEKRSTLTSTMFGGEGGINLLPLKDFDISDSGVDRERANLVYGALGKMIVRSMMEGYQFEEFSFHPIIWVMACGMEFDHRIGHQGLMSFLAAYDRDLVNDIEHRISSADENSRLELTMILARLDDIGDTSSLNSTKKIDRMDQMELLETVDGAIVAYLKDSRSLNLVSLVEPIQAAIKRMGSESVCWWDLANLMHPLEHVYAVDLMNNFFLSDNLSAKQAEFVRYFLQTADRSTLRTLVFAISGFQSVAGLARSQSMIVIIPQTRASGGRISYLWENPTLVLPEHKTFEEFLKAMNRFLSGVSPAGGPSLLKPTPEQLQQRVSDTTQTKCHSGLSVRYGRIIVHGL